MFRNKSSSIINLSGIFDFNCQITLGDDQLGSVADQHIVVGGHIHATMFNGDGGTSHRRFTTIHTRIAHSHMGYHITRCQVGVGDSPQNRIGGLVVGIAIVCCRHRRSIHGQHTSLNSQGTGSRLQRVVTGRQSGENRCDGVRADVGILTAIAVIRRMVGIQTRHHTHIITALITCDGIIENVRLSVSAGDVNSLHREYSRRNYQRTGIFYKGIVGRIGTCIQGIVECIGIGAHCDISSWIAKGVGGSLSFHKTIADRHSGIVNDSRSIVGLGK